MTWPDTNEAASLTRKESFTARHADQAPAALHRLKATAADPDGNVFDALMDAVRHCTLGQITEAFFEVGGQYRRNI